MIVRLNGKEVKSSTLEGLELTALDSFINLISKEENTREKFDSFLAKLHREISRSTNIAALDIMSRVDDSKNIVFSFSFTKE